MDTEGPSGHFLRIAENSRSERPRPALAGAPPSRGGGGQCKSGGGGMSRGVVLALAAALPVAAGSAALSPAAAWAQSAVNVVTKAEDAFGERIGLERIGLYSESQVRGFSLSTAGNYRIDGAYFAKEIGLANPVIGGVTTRVGWNALSADFAAPSGIVEYRLKSAEPGKRLDIEGGVLEFASPYLSISGSAATGDGRWGVSGGFEVRPHGDWGDGQIVRNYAVGIVPEWRPNMDTSVKAFASVSYESFPGDYGFVATGPALPPPPVFPQRYPASWAHWRYTALNTGVIARTRTKGWDLQASAFLSDYYLHPVDFTVLAVDGQGLGRAIGVYSHNGPGHSWSGEMKASRSLGDHSRVFAMARGRLHAANIPTADVFDLGPIDIRLPTPATPAPTTGPAVRTLDEASQVTAGLGVETRLWDRLRIRATVQRTRYQKTVTPQGQPGAASIDTPWLYDASAVFALSRTWTLFATAARGLEETGKAPASAANVGAILPAAISKQYELGARVRLSDKLSLIGSAFQIEKPTPGFDAANVFQLLYQERHRGLELSLTGQLAPRLTAVLGAVALQPRVSGPLVTSGRRSDEPVGVSKVLALANLSWEPKGLKGISIDGGVGYTGGRLVHASGDLHAPGYWTVNLGGRYSFKAGGRDMVLRVYGSNLTDTRAWNVSQSGILYWNSPRSVRATLSTSFR